MTDDPRAGARDAYRDELTHVDEHGDVRMVDVSEKETTRRVAIAGGTILMHPETQAMVLEDRAKKGDVLACARVAGIMAAKRTSDIIPMCHPLMITKAKVDIAPIAAPGAVSAAAPGELGEPGGAGVSPEGWAPPREDGRVGFRVTATCGVTGVTGIEMEALTAASAACLTIYDMCKAVDRGMEIVDVRLLRKEGGRSGLWERGTTDGDGAAEAEDEGGAPAPSNTPAAAPAPSKTPRAAAPARPAPAIAFIGYQNSGKTTLVEKVIAVLTRRGVRVGTVKHHGHAGFDIDVPGKDSWRHARAGSRHVGIVSAARYAEYADTETELSLERLLARYTDVDVVIVEGYKSAGLPNIVVARSGVDRLRGANSLDLVDGRTVANACNDALSRGARPEAPVVDLNDEEAVADVVERWLQEG